MDRRTQVVLLALCLAVAGGIAAGVVLAFPGGGGGPSRAEYLARADAICQVYGRKLDRIPPPDDIASPGSVLASVSAALPILKDQEQRIRALEPPAELRALVQRFFVLTNRSIADLEAVLRAARKPDVGQIGIGLIHFGTTENAAKKLAHQIGYSC